MAVDGFEAGTRSKCDRSSTGEQASHVRARWDTVVGFEPELSSFFWFACQGAYGFQIAPGPALIDAALVTNAAAPEGIAPRVLSADALSPLALHKQA